MLSPSFISQYSVEALLSHRHRHSRCNRRCDCHYRCLSRVLTHMDESCRIHKCVVAHISIVVVALVCDDTRHCHPHSRNRQCHRYRHRHRHTHRRCYSHGQAATRRYCNTLQHTAAHCSTWQHAQQQHADTATRTAATQRHYNALQYALERRGDTATHCKLHCSDTATPPRRVQAQIYFSAIALFPSSSSPSSFCSRCFQVSPFSSLSHCTCSFFFKFAPLSVKSPHLT